VRYDKAELAAWLDARRVDPAARHIANRVDAA
jgi:hypothetical protein